MMFKACQESISLTHEKSLRFVISQWQKDLEPSWAFLLYRSLVAGLFVSVCIASITLHEKNDDDLTPRRGFWFIFLTHWGFLLCTLQFIWALAMLSVSFITKRQEVKTYKIYWVLQTIAMDLSIIITLLYWSLVYNGQEIDAENVFVHLLNSVFMLIDLFLVSHPVNFLHGVFSVIFALFYSLFTLIYYYSGGTNRDGKPYIYKVLNWKNPLTTSMLCIGVALGILTVHSTVWILFKLRNYIYSKTVKKKHDAHSIEIA